MKKYSVVLSGGAALGLAHIGVLKYIKEKNILIKELIGTSMGAIIAAIYAVDIEEEKRNLYLKKINNLQNWIKIQITTKNIVEIEKIEKILIEIFGDKKISETKIKLKIIASNFETGEVKKFSSKSNIKIKDAIIASMSIPGIFPQKEINNKKYVDGYLTSNLPIEYAKEKNIIASNVINLKEYEIKKENKIFFKKTTNLIQSQERAFKIIIVNQTKQKIKELEKKKNIMLIEPEINKYKTFHFNKFEELIEIGYKEAERNLFF